MTREEIATMIDGFGVPFAYGEFWDDDGDGEKPQAVPYIYFSYTSLNNLICYSLCNIFIFINNYFLSFRIYYFLISKST